MELFVQAPFGVRCLCTEATNFSFIYESDVFPLS
jgi:hypothetical protein